MRRDQHRPRAERRGGAQDRPDIMRVAYLVEHHDDAARRQCGGAQDVVEFGRLQRLDLERQPLMHRIVGKQRGETLSIQHAQRVSLAATHGARTGDQRAGVLLLRGQRRQAPPAAFRIGQRGGHGVSAVKPPLALRSFRPRS